MRGRVVENETSGLSEVSIWFGAQQSGSYQQERFV